MKEYETCAETALCAPSLFTCFADDLIHKGTNYQWRLIYFHAFDSPNYFAYFHVIRLMNFGMAALPAF